MCTVSIVPTADGCRVMCNRDEQRTRAAGRPPRVRPTERSWAAYPDDPVSGGTWIGVNGDGLVIVLLNRTATVDERRRAPLSRGTIVPRLLSCASIAQAMHAYEALDVRQFEPFRLVMVQRAAIAVADPARTATETVPLTSPVMYTSSSLGDAFVEPPRRRLFEQLVLAVDDWLHGQELFHRHRWTSRPEISIDMAREDAATVSRTTIDVTSGSIDLEYESLSGDAHGGAGGRVRVTC
jgi:transport and Golgi organization protein 2